MLRPRPRVCGCWQNFASQVADKLRSEEKLEEALPYALRMLSAKPDDPMVLLFAGEIVIRNGDIAKAREIFTKVTQICKPGSNEHEQVSLFCIL